MKKRVCILGRVSTLDKSQNTSIDYQINHLTQVILDNPEYIFNPDTDIYFDRFTGTKIDRKNTKGQGFNDLMKSLGIEIIDNTDTDRIELSIIGKKNVKPRYDLIFCKSTSRFARTDTKGGSLLEILKQLNIEVFFEDLNISTFDDDLVIKINSIMDNRYSKNMSYNNRANNIYKTINNMLMLKGERFGWDRVKINGLAYYKINKTEYEALRLAYDMLVNQDLGCESIAKEFIKRDIKTKQNIYMEKSRINKILKDRHYMGYEKYYDYPDDYLKRFGVDRDLLKSINYVWKPCEYIEPIFTEEEFENIQQKFNERSKTGRGFRNPYLTITKKLKCGSCGSNYYSIGDTNYFKERAYKCATKRVTPIRRTKECNNFTVYEPYLNEYLNKLNDRFSFELENIYKHNLNNLLYLKYHLALILNTNTDSAYIDLLEKREELETQLENLLLANLTSESGLKTVQKIKNKLDKELKEIDDKIIIYTDLENQIKRFILEVDKIYNKLAAERKQLKSNYTNAEMLDMIKYIYVFPKTAEKRHRNQIAFVSQTVAEVETFNLLDNIFKSEVGEVLPPKTFAISETKTNKRYIVKTPTQEEIETATDLLESLDLLYINS